MNKLHFLLSETIFLMNNLFGLQLLWLLFDVLSYYMYETCYDIMKDYNKVQGDESVPDWFIEDTIVIPARSLSTMHFVIVVWICSDITAQVKLLYISHCLTNTLTYQYMTKKY